jgi:hypothetical protein
MVAVRAQTIWGVIPLGAACGGGDDPRRKPARSRAPANSLVCANEGSDDGMPTTPRRRALGDAASCWAAAVRLGNFGEKISTKNPRRISPCGPYDFCDDDIMPVICPTCQTILEPLPNCIKCSGIVSTNCNCFGRSSQKRKLAAGFQRRLYGIGDGANVPLICPTHQALTRSDGVRRHRNQIN